MRVHQRPTRDGTRASRRQRERLYLEKIRELVRRFAGLRETESFARSWDILMKGSIVSAAEGDTEAAQRGKTMARQLIDQ